MQSRPKISAVSDIFIAAQEYFRGVQNEDGGFPYNDLGSPSGTWATAGVLWALVAISPHAIPDYLLKALDYLMGQQQGDGSLAITTGAAPCVDATAQFLLAAEMISKSRPSTDLDKAVKMAGSWLYARSLEGGWSTLENSNAVVSSTSLVLLALKANEGTLAGDPEYASTLEKGVNWLTNTRNHDFGWGLYRGNASKAGSTAFALIALSRCLTSESAQKTSLIQSGIEFVLSKQLDTGGWPDAIERAGGTTVIRLSSCYCLMALALNGFSLKDIRFQRAFSHIVRSFRNGRLVYQDSDIVSWSTRDGLLALEAFQRNVEQNQLLELLDQNIALDAQRIEIEMKLDALSTEFAKYRAGEDERVNKIVAAELDKASGSYNAFRVITSALILALLACTILALGFAVQLTETETIAVTGFSLTIWGVLTAIINSVKFPYPEKRTS